MRMPSAGQKFEVLGLWFEVRKSRGRLIKAIAKVEDPIFLISKQEGEEKSMYEKLKDGKFTLLETKFKVIGLQLAGKKLKVEALA